MNEKRIKILKNGEIKFGPVVYWMSRDQRVNDNWALLYAQQKAIENKQNLIVIFNLVPKFLEASIRQYGFMLKGLEEVEKELSRFNISFSLLIGDPAQNIVKYVNDTKVSVLISDFSPLKIVREWKNKVALKIKNPFYEIDAHNIVPCWEASDKLEFAAYTIRPKINRKLNEYLIDFPNLKKMPRKNKNYSNPVNWSHTTNSLRIDFSIPEVDWLQSGEKAASMQLNRFIEKKLNQYAENRNDPALNFQSQLSPYIHFGQISAQRIALTIQNLNKNVQSTEAFLEELIVRRELSDNFCYYNSDYDSVKGFPDWAKKTLNEHRNDKRAHLYSIEQFEKSQTHDKLWNAAQQEIVQTGKMHGYMRMYWAKKILEWSKSPEQALETAIYLNDKYSLDGRDPNGYTGCAWSIGGVHDRAWGEREVFGKIRYMNYNGCKRKFDLDKYISAFLNTL
ncbi:MAG: deoxyribodipyrimidine photo-lyase [Ignavibacteria bacterium]|nr:deoxyribodipyrimidine photo-lyase [Ignavibacteria bacterium]